MERKQRLYRSWASHLGIEKVLYFNFRLYGKEGLDECGGESTEMLVIGVSFFGVSFRKNKWTLGRAGLTGDGCLPVGYGHLKAGCQRRRQQLSYEKDQCEELHCYACSKLHP